MRINLIAAFLLCLGVASCSSDSDYAEGQSTLSPNKKWFVDLDTGTNRLTRIRIYDTDVYPVLKTNPDPVGTPTALFIVPIEFHARSVDLKWNPASTVLRLEQPVSGGTNAPIYYCLDLDSFSFSKVEQ